jgi:NAD(P)-dependent dehydrogenase (short-subunit alcohol dehydrogenase family)
MLGMVRTPAVALDADGIAVTAVAPVLTDAPASRAVNQDGQFEAVVARKAMKRSLGPEDTAHTSGLPCPRRCLGADRAGSRGRRWPVLR